jgi:hypothetical protein
LRLLDWSTTFCVRAIRAIDFCIFVKLLVDFAKVGVCFIFLLLG